MKIVNIINGRTIKRPYFTSKEIEETCIQELDAVGLLPKAPSPIRIERFIDKRFNLSPDYRSLSDGLSGYTRFGRNGVEEIVIAASLDNGILSTERYLRTTLAHEAGHGIFHAHLFYLGKKPISLFGKNHSNEPKILCRDISGGRSNDQQRKQYKGEWWEFQANKAMGALLVPRCLVRSAIEPFLTKRGLFGLTLEKERRTEAIKKLSDVFDVNPIVVQIRLEEIFPLSEDCQGTF